MKNNDALRIPASSFSLNFKSKIITIKAGKTGDSDSNLNVLAISLETLSGKGKLCPFF
jgi:hypothetical protein